MPAFLIYGATGYTGQLAAEHAAASGLRPVLAGRNREKLRILAGRTGLEWRVFSLDAPETVREGIKGVAAVLHTAGPFSATSKPMRDACLRSGLHYIDITGELEVLRRSLHEMPRPKMLVSCCCLVRALTWCQATAWQRTCGRDCQPRRGYVCRSAGWEL